MAGPRRPCHHDPSISPEWSAGDRRLLELHVTEGGHLHAGHRGVMARQVIEEEGVQRRRILVEELLDLAHCRLLTIDVDGTLVGGEQLVEGG